jgi:membrane associated rhomboid family serine protease
MITQFLQQAVDFFAAAIDLEFWQLTGTVVLVIACSVVAGWFFPVLRSVAGAVALAAGSLLYGFIKGRKSRKPEPKKEPGEGNPWKW